MTRLEVRQRLRMYASNSMSAPVAWRIRRIICRRLRAASGGPRAPPRQSRSGRCRLPRTSSGSSSSSSPDSLPSSPPPPCHGGAWRRRRRARTRRRRRLRRRRLRGLTLRRIPLSRAAILGDELVASVRHAVRRVNPPLLARRRRRRRRHGRAAQHRLDLAFAAAIAAAEPRSVRWASVVVLPRCSRTPARRASSFNPGNPSST